MQDKPQGNLDDDLMELQEHAQAQAALFEIGPAESNSVRATDVDNDGAKLPDNEILTD